MGDFASQVEGGLGSGETFFEVVVEVDAVDEVPLLLLLV